MIHKIHMGSSLPSVIAGTPYQIIGYQNSVNDFSKIVFPAPNMKCETCHDQTNGASNAAAYKTTPNRAACGSCHDNVNFATGVNHGGGGPQLSDQVCSTCHQPYVSDFDISILGAHVVPQESNLLGGIQWAITKVSNATPGQQATITFTLADTSGKPLAPSDFNRLALTIAGPSTDNVAFTTGYVQETVTAANVSGGNGTFTYTFNTPIPSNATGTFAVGLEGRRLETVLANTTLQQSIQYGAKNPVMYFSVDGTPVTPRRTPVAIANCQTCHYRLSLHGENRVGNTEYCVFCHNPVENDSAYRPAGTGPNQTIDFKFLVHRVHGGATLAAQYGTDYSVYGFGGSLNDFSGVLYPSALGDCFKCHTNGSENPSDAAITMSPVNTPRYPLNPMPGITTACYGCHDSTVMLAHAQSQTTSLGESCSTCHSLGSAYAATQVHAAVNTVDAGQAAK
jgi:OmcA/MtrC family decaheme c-type cytochrome